MTGCKIRSIYLYVLLFVGYFIVGKCTFIQVIKNISIARKHKTVVWEFNTNMRGQHWQTFALTFPYTCNWVPTAWVGCWKLATLAQPTFNNCYDISNLDFSVAKVNITGSYTPISGNCARFLISSFLAARMWIVLVILLLSNFGFYWIWGM